MGDLKILRNMGTMSRKEIGLENWFPPLGPYSLKVEVIIVVAYVTLRMVFTKRRYA